VASPPAVRQEGDTTIIPVLREVLVVEKRYELVEEVHVTKKKTVVPHVQEITLRKEVVEVERKPLQDGNQL
jgi:stress response protein YsnF